jgi:hypothetical protein
MFIYILKRFISNSTTELQLGSSQLTQPFLRYSLIKNPCSVNLEHHCILRNYEMKDERYCFVKFTTAKYEIHCFITERNINIVEFLSS